MIRWTFYAIIGCLAVLSFLFTIGLGAAGMIYDKVKGIERDPETYKRIN